MFESASQRTFREFWVYRGRQLVLAIQDRPGTLHSLAAPPAGGVPTHPFLHAIAYDIWSEDELGQLLRQSDSFDQYVELLIGAGYDLMSAQGVPQLDAAACFRLEGEGRAVGAMWHKGGQFTTLWRQPAENELVYPYATLTAYDREFSQALFDSLQTAGTFRSLRRKLQERGVRILPATD